MLVRDQAQRRDSRCVRWVLAAQPQGIELWSGDREVAKLDPKSLSNQVPVNGDALTQIQSSMRMRNISSQRWLPGVEAHKGESDGDAAHNLLKLFTLANAA